jgi:hypothetical protein
MAPQQSHLLQASSAMLWPASQATLAEKVQVLDWDYSNGKNQTTTVAHFRCSSFPKLCQSTLSRWLQKEQLFRTMLAADIPLSMKRQRPVKNHKFERRLQAWIMRMEEQ